MKKEYIEIIDTKITDKWGVFWNEMETVRDFLQNFFDANSVKDIKIEVNESTVEVFAPQIFDYQELLYLGSDKGGNSESIGQYGEGWKASVLNAMRNFNCGVEIIVKDKRLSFYFEHKEIGDTFKRVIFCKVYDEIPINGSKLIVSRCSKKMIHEFKFGLRYFYYEGNPLLGEELTSTHDDKVMFFKSNEKEGYVFYNKLLRSRLDIPIVIVCNKSYHHIEVKIKHDRDRKAFNDEVLERLLKYTCKAIWNKSDIIEHLKDYWSNGHKFLNILANSINRWNRMSYKFPEIYFARDSGGNKDEVKSEKAKVLKEFELSNYIACPSYMSRFGMKTAIEIAEKRVQERESKKSERHLENLKQHSRQTNFFEQSAINLLTEYIRKHSKPLFEKCHSYKYVLCESANIVRDLKLANKEGKNTIYLTKSFFTYNFPDALVLMISEWQKLDGYTKVLNDFYISLLTAFLKYEDTISEIKNYEKNWNEIINKIIEEKGFISFKPNAIKDNELPEKLRELFMEGKIHEVIDSLKEVEFEDKKLENDFILLAEQYNSWHRNNLKGISNPDPADINKIKVGILSLINAMKN